MPEPDRFAELVRQRVLVREHLAWLDREIARASPPGSANTPSTPPGSGPKPPAPAEPPIFAPPSVGALQAHPADAERILAHYRVAPTAVKDNVRKGCLLYFVAALALVALGVTLLYLAFGARRA